ncbi:MAG: sodium:solute symporter family protein [Ruminococcaceae bacterium]|nr:sodium:solute symporter family protein [Oscillospiraceae bacterium]
MVIKIVLLVVFFAAMIAVGLYCHKKSTDVNGFVLGGRSVGPWLTAFAYGTSYFSAVIFVGYAGQFGWKFGIASTWIGLGNAFLGSLLAWVVLGRRTRLQTQHLSTATMPEYFGKRYQSDALKIVASIIVFIFLIPYTASLYNGLSRLFEMAFPGISYSTCVIVMAVLTGVYVTAGGYMATAINDFIQGIIMIGGIIAVIATVLNGHGGFSASLAALANVPSATPAGEALPGGFASFFGPDPVNLLCVVVLTSLGTWGLPQMVQKFYAIKNEKAIAKGTVISTIFAVIVAGGCYFLGGFGRISGLDYTAATPQGGFDAIIPKMLENLPDLLIGVVIILVLSASMSTLSSLVLASSSTLTLDMIKGHMIKKMSEKKQVLIMRILITVFIAISAFIAINKDKLGYIADMMGISWGALAGAFLAPFLYGLYGKWVSRASVWASFIFGSGIMVLNMFFRASFPPFLQSPINCGALAMVGGLIIVPIVSMFTPKQNKETVDAMFTCYDLEVTTKSVNSLTEI